MIKISKLDVLQNGHEDLLSFRGPLYEGWLDAWNRLGPAERDLCTHPVWIISYLRCCRDIPELRKKREGLKLYIAEHAGKIVAGIPLAAEPLPLSFGRMQVLRSPFIHHRLLDRFSPRAYGGDSRGNSRCRQWIAFTAVDDLRPCG